MASLGDNINLFLVYIGSFFPGFIFDGVPPFQDVDALRDNAYPILTLVPLSFFLVEQVFRIFLWDCLLPVRG